MMGGKKKLSLKDINSQDIPVPLVIALVVPGVLATMILEARADGKIRVGEDAFFLMLIMRICYALGAVECWIFTLPSLKKLVHKRLASAILAVVVFVALYHPVMDIPYLCNPAYVDLTATETRLHVEDNPGYSIFYSIRGTDQNGQELSFDVGRATYELLEPQPGVPIHVVYLPNTRHVLSVEVTARP